MYRSVKNYWPDTQQVLDERVCFHFDVFTACQEIRPVLCCKFVLSVHVCFILSSTWCSVSQACQLILRINFLLPLCFSEEESARKTRCVCLISFPVSFLQTSAVPCVLESRSGAKQRCGGPRCLDQKEKRNSKVGLNIAVHLATSPWRTFGCSSCGRVRAVSASIW